MTLLCSLFLFQAEDGIRDWSVTGVQTCALSISSRRRHTRLVFDQAEDGIRDWSVTGVQTCALPIFGQAWGETDSKKVAVHEFAHTVTLKLLIDYEAQPLDSKAFDKKFATFPTWLWEAISVYEAEQLIDPKALPFLNNGSYPSLSELNDRSKGGKIYKVGYSVIEYILYEYGRDKLIELVKNYGSVQKVFAITDEQFCKDWYEFVKRKYLK